MIAIADANDLGQFVLLFGDVRVQLLKPDEKNTKTLECFLFETLEGGGGRNLLGLDPFHGFDLRRNRPQLRLQHAIVLHETVAAVNVIKNDIARVDILPTAGQTVRMHAVSTQSHAERRIVTSTTVERDTVCRFQVRADQGGSSSTQEKPHFKTQIYMMKMINLIFLKIVFQS